MWLMLAQWLLDSRLLNNVVSFQRPKETGFSLALLTSSLTATATTKHWTDSWEKSWCHRKSYAAITSIFLLLLKQLHVNPQKVFLCIMFSIRVRADSVILSLSCSGSLGKHERRHVHDNGSERGWHIWKNLVGAYELTHQSGWATDKYLFGVKVSMDLRKEKKKKKEWSHV